MLIIIFSGYHSGKALNRDIDLQHERRPQSPVPQLQHQNNFISIPYLSGIWRKEVVGGWGRGKIVSKYHEEDMKRSKVCFVFCKRINFVPSVLIW